ncbi:hypothetical protein RFI_01643, partial [Reticulomyxa filosa]
RKYYYEGRPYHGEIEKEAMQLEGKVRITNGDDSDSHEMRQLKVCVEKSLTHWDGMTNANATEIWTYLRDKWLERGVHEHASIASFNKLMLELMTMDEGNMDVEWLSFAIQAQTDELRHTQIAFHYANCFHNVWRMRSADMQLTTTSLQWQVFAPGPLPSHNLTIGLKHARDVAQIIVDGCFHETISALLLAQEVHNIRQCEMALPSDDPMKWLLLRLSDDVLAIANDELHHSIFAWMLFWKFSQNSEWRSAFHSSLLDPLWWNTLLFHAKFNTLSVLPPSSVTVLQCYGVVDTFQTQLVVTHAVQYIFPSLLSSLRNSHNLTVFRHTLTNTLQLYPLSSQCAI